MRYEAVNATLLNDFLKGHRQAAELEAVLVQERAANAQQQKQIDSLIVGLQQVSDRVELSSPAAQGVSNRR